MKRRLNTMKNLMSFAVVLCALLLATPALGQRKPRIRGNRVVVSIDRELPPFSHLVLEDDLEVQLRPGASESVRIEADDNLVDILRFDLDGDTLRIASFYNITAKKQLDLTLSYTRLESIQVTAGNLTGADPVKADQMNVRVGEGGRARLEILGTLVSVDLEENASADLRLRADSVALRATGRADAHLYSQGGGLMLELTGSASLVVDGDSPGLQAVLSGNTRLEAQGLEALEASVTLGESSHGRIRAADHLSYEGSGDSRLFVYGQPRVTVRGFRDRAELRKAPE
jgi:hypothetical protein